MVERRARLRRTASETREILVEEGLRQLQATGLQIGLDHLTLESACTATDVPRSSSHAAWAIDDDFTPQALFQRTVLQTWLAEREDTMFAEAAQDAVLKLYADHGDDASASDVVRATVQAAFERGFNAGSLSDLDEGAYLSTDLAIRFAIASQPDPKRDEEILDWLRAGEMSNRADRIEDSYKPLARLLGLEPKPEFGERAYVLFGIAVASLVEGIGLRHLILPELELDQPISDAGDGHVAPLLIGACVEALIPRFFDEVRDQ